jgi:cerevisin
LFLQLTNSGIHVVVAAGNKADDAYYYTPAGAPSAITVAASDINDNLAYFSNWGNGRFFLL